MAVGKDDECRFIQCNTLRRVVGLLGVGLPIILAIWGFFLLCGIKLMPSISAGSLFVVLAYFSIFLFTKSAGEKPYPPRKRARNRIYRVCGIVMLLCIVLIGVFKIWLADTPIADLKPVFWLEALALWAFGISWFTKGETIFRDAKDTEPKAKSS